MADAKSILKELFPTSNPSEASRDRSGAVEASKPERKTRKEADYLPILAVGVGVGLLALAFLKPQPLAVERREPSEEPSYESDYPQTGPGY